MVVVGHVYGRGPENLSLRSTHWVFVAGQLVERKTAGPRSGSHFCQSRRGSKSARSRGESIAYEPHAAFQQPPRRRRGRGFSMSGFSGGRAQRLGVDTSLVAPEACCI